MDEFDHKRLWGPMPSYPKVIEYFSQEKHDGLISIAGPCSIESFDQINKIAKELKRVGVTYMRGGVFRAGTYPPRAMNDFGLRRDLLKTWSGIAKNNGLKIIVEVLDYRDLDYIAQFADAFQVGARHMQDYTLLVELSRTGKVVTLKRNQGATLDEFLGAAEYLCRGTCHPVLVERGSSTYHNHVRWDLSISIIAAIKRITDIPILVDASHGGGRRDLVLPLLLGGMAAGADGFLVEIHPDPENSISDSDQAIHLLKYEAIKKMARKIKETVWL